MENASTALLIAGGILLALMVIGLLVLTYNKIRADMGTSSNIAEVKQLAEFNKSFEVYNRNNLRGSDIISIVNKIEDYNEKESNSKGFTRISLDVTMRRIDSNYFKGFSSSDYKSILQAYTRLQNKIDELGDYIDSNGKSVAYYSSYTSVQLLNLDQTTQNKVEEYNLLKSYMKEFKNKKFKCTNIDYDNNTGRIRKLIIVEG